MEEFDIRQEGRNKEKDFENALRPLRFEDFSGQQKVVENLRIFVEAAKYRGEPLDHTLLHGPPGLGKTTLSNIIANELGVGFKLTSGPVLDKPGDLAGILTSLEANDVLFIDEIHRLSPVVFLKNGARPSATTTGYRCFIKMRQTSAWQVLSHECVDNVLHLLSPGRTV